MKEKIEKFFADFNRKVSLDSVIPEQKDQESVKVSVDDIEELKNTSANKSKIKETVLEKLKRFYYLHFYEVIQIGQANDEEYKKVLKEEIEAQEEKLEKTKEKSEENIYNIAGISAKASELVSGIETKKQEEIEKKIDDYKQVVAEIEEQEQMEKIEQNLENIAQEEAQQITQEKQEPTTEQVTEENNQAEEQKDIQTNEEIQLQPINESQKEIQQEETPVEIEQEPTEEELMISEEKREFIAAVEKAYDDAVQKLEQKHTAERKLIKEEAANKLTDAQTIIQQVSEEANEKIANMKKENEQLQSHYDQATAMIETQRNEIEEKDKTILELNEQVAAIPAKDAEIARLQQIEASYIAIKNALSFNQPVQPVQQTEEPQKTL